jgi:hypothetical protein
MLADRAKAPSDRFAATSPVNGGGIRLSSPQPNSSPVYGGSTGEAGDGGFSVKPAGRLKHSVQGHPKSTLPSPQKILHPIRKCAGALAVVKMAVEAFLRKHKNMKLVFFTFLLVIMSFTAKASNELCITNAHPDTASVSLASDTTGWRYHHPWSDNRGHTLKGYRFTPDLAQFLSVLESLDNNWGTPTAPWPKKQYHRQHSRKWRRYLSNRIFTKRTIRPEQSNGRFLGEVVVRI